MSARRLAVAAAVAAVAAAGLAAVPEARAQGVGIRGLVSFGTVQMTAKDSFDAIFGTSSVNEIGGGVQVTNLWRGVFAEVSGGRSKETGERAFVNGGTVFSLGIPVDITLRPLDIVGGYRFNRSGRFVPYVGGGYTSVAYEETSPFALPGDDIDERYGGFVVLGGVEVRTTRWLHLRGEARYRQVPDALGEGGVSSVFGEDSLGGLRLGVAVAIGR